MFGASQAGKVFALFILNLSFILPFEAFNSAYALDASPNGETPPAREIGGRSTERSLDPALFGDWAGVDSASENVYFVHIVTPYGLTNTTKAAAIVYMRPKETHAAAGSLTLFPRSFMVFAIEPAAAGRVALFQMGEDGLPPDFHNCCTIDGDAKPTLLVIYEIKRGHLIVRIRNASDGFDRKVDAESDDFISLNRVRLGESGQTN